MNEEPAMETALLVQREGPVLTLPLNRPKRKNALSREMVVTMADEVIAAGEDDETRIVVIRAAGADFCSGMDLAQSNQRLRDAGSGAAQAPAASPRIGHLRRSFQTGPHRLIAAMEQMSARTF